MFEIMIYFSAACVSAGNISLFSRLVKERGRGEGDAESAAQDERRREMWYNGYASLPDAEKKGTPAHHHRVRG